MVLNQKMQFGVASLLLFQAVFILLAYCSMTRTQMADIEYIVSVPLPLGAVPPYKTNLETRSRSVAFYGWPLPCRPHDNTSLYTVVETNWLNVCLNLAIAALVGAMVSLLFALGRRLAGLRRVRGGKRVG